MNKPEHHENYPEIFMFNTLMDKIKDCFRDVDEIKLDKNGNLLFDEKNKAISDLYIQNSQELLKLVDEMYQLVRKTGFIPSRYAVKSKEVENYWRLLYVNKGANDRKGWWRFRGDEEMAVDFKNNILLSFLFSV